eukprot:g733.t1
MAPALRLRGTRFVGCCDEDECGGGGGGGGGGGTAWGELSLLLRLVLTSRESLRAALLIEPRLPRALCVGAPADTGLAASVPSGVAFRGARSLESRRAASANDPLPRGAAGGTRKDSLFLQLLLASLFESLRAALLMEPRLRGAKCVADGTDPAMSVPAPGISEVAVPEILSSPLFDGVESESEMDSESELSSVSSLVLPLASSRVKESRRAAREIEPSDRRRVPLLTLEFAAVRTDVKLSCTRAPCRESRRAARDREPEDACTAAAFDAVAAAVYDGLAMFSESRRAASEIDLRVRIFCATSSDAPGVDSEALLDADSDVVLDVVLDVLEVLGVGLDADVVLDALSAVDPDSNCDRVAPSALLLKLFSCEMPRVLAML